MQGSLVELTPNDHITIHLATGEIRRIAWADIDSSGSGSSDAQMGAAQTAPNGVPVTTRSSRQGLGDAPGVSADAPPPHVSHVGAHGPVDLRIPMGVTVTSPGPVMNMFGFGFGVGKRLTHELYLGAFVEYDSAWNLSDAASESSSGLYSLWRAGADLHYIVHRGTAQMSTDDVNYYPVPSQLWIGGRASGPRRPICRH